MTEIFTQEPSIIPLPEFLKMKEMWYFVEWINKKFTKEETINMMIKFFNISEEELLKKFSNLKESNNSTEDSKSKNIIEFVKFTKDEINWKVFTTLRTFSNDNEFKFIWQTWTHRIYNKNY